MILRYAKQLPGNKRFKVLDGVNLICWRYENGETCTSINMPPRYGKSDVIRLAAQQLNATTGLPGVMMAPWTDNADQIKEQEKIDQMYERYGIPTEVPFTTHRCRALKTNEWWKTANEIPTLISCTIGLVQNKANQQQFLDGIADLHQRFGARVPVFIDEAHLVKELQNWGQFSLQIIAYGGYVVLLTGTAVPGLLGFKDDADDWIDTARHIPRKLLIKGEIKHVLEHYEGQKRTVKEIKADLNVTWKEAWEIGALAKVNAVWIDVDVTDKDTGESLGALSTLPKAELNGRLRSIEESEEMIRKKADAAVDRFFQLRSRENTKAVRVLVVTGSDLNNENSNGSNIHARAYEEALRDSIALRGYDRDAFRIEIATGVDNDGNPNPASTKTVKDFRKGKVEFLIVKLKAIVGLDVPECKVLLFGSTLRNGPMAIQALSRVLTTWECRATMILSSDIAMVELYDRVVTDNGGEFTESNLHLVNVEEVPPPDGRPEWKFQNAKVGSYGDENGEVTQGDFELELRIIKAKYHTNGLSDRQIIENFQSGGFPVSDNDKKEDERARKEKAASGIRDLDEGLDENKGTFGKDAKEIVNKYINYGHDPLLWKKKVADLQAEAKRICGVARYIKVHHIDDASLLQRLKEALPQAEQMVFGRGQSSQNAAV